MSLPAPCGSFSSSLRTMRCELYEGHVGMHQCRGFQWYDEPFRIHFAEDVPQCTAMSSPEFGGPVRCSLEAGHDPPHQSGKMPFMRMWQDVSGSNQLPAGGRMTRKTVLDHGYVELIEHWGSDERIIESARMSTGKGFIGWQGELGPCAHCDRGWIHTHTETESSGTLCPTCNGRGQKPGDEKLLRHLWINKHTTPFEMAGLTIEVQAPIFVIREWHRHRTMSYNEHSARYAPLPDLNYVPSIERLLIASSTQNKQAQALAGVLSSSGAEGVQGLLDEIYAKLEHSYQHMLRNGVPKELARLVLPVGRYSKMRASANLLNWFRFITLRADSHAQWEMQEYANAVLEIVHELFPRTATLFDEK